MSRVRKDYRRALELLKNQDHVFHATSPEGLRGVVESGVIRPGKRNLYSPDNAEEVYTYAGAPTGLGTPYDITALAMPQTRLLPDMPGPAGTRTRILTGEGGEKGHAEHWAVTPHAIPVKQRDTVIAPKGSVPRDLQVSGRLHTIAPEQFWAAYMDLGGSAGQRMPPLKNYREDPIPHLTDGSQRWRPSSIAAVPTRGTAVPKAFSHLPAEARDEGRAYTRALDAHNAYLESLSASPVKIAAATPLQPHQQRVVDRLQRDDQPGLVAIHGLGSGKTLTSIAAADALGRNTHAIVPASLQQNYLKELEKHKAEVTPDLSTLQAVTRRGELPTATDEDFLVIDEAHRLREPGTKGYQTVRDIPAAKRLLLTASPTYNRPSDIAPLVNIAAGKRVLPGSQQDFEARYVGQQTVDPGFIARVFRGIQPGSRPVLQNTKELGGILKKWTDYHENPTDTADFPTRIDEVIEVPMSDTQQDVYKTITGKAPAWVQYKIRKGLPPSKAESQDLNAFLTGARQAQLSPGVFQQGGAPAGAATKQRAAFERFKASLEANPDHKAVVYSNYLDAGLSPYRQMLDEHQIPYAAFTGDMKARERAQAVKDYNEGKLRALLVSSAGGEGLDLKGTRQMQILEPHFNQEKLKQVIGRGIRYQSHADLPEDQRQVAVEQYLSTMPKRTGLKKFFLGDADTTADQYLHQMSQDKERLNQQLHDLLRGQQR